MWPSPVRSAESPSSGRTTSSSTGTFCPEYSFPIYIYTHVCIYVYIMYIYTYIYIYIRIYVHVCVRTVCAYINRCIRAIRVQWYIFFFCRACSNSPLGDGTGSKGLIFRVDPDIDQTPGIRLFFFSSVSGFNSAVSRLVVSFLLSFLLLLLLSSPPPSPSFPFFRFFLSVISRWYFSSRAWIVVGCLEWRLRMNYYWKGRAPRSVPVTLTASRRAVSRTVYTSEVRLWSPPFGDVWRCLASIERSVSLGAGSIVAFPARSSKIDSRLKDVSVLGLCVPSRRVVPERRFGLNSGERKTKFFEVFEFEGFEYDDSNFLRKILEEKVCSRIRIRDEFVRIFSLPRNFDSFYKVVCIK